METIFLASLKLSYLMRYASQFGKPVGCSEGDLQKFERDLGQRLPLAHREFLLWMGNDRQGRLKGSDWFLDDLCENTRSLHELLSENGLSLAEFSAPFCFFMHQGYMAAWFDLASVEGNPKCYFFSESTESRSIEGPIDFTTFLKRDLGL